MTKYKIFDHQYDVVVLGAGDMLLEDDTMQLLIVNFNSMIPINYLVIITVIEIQWRNSR